MRHSPTRSSTGGAVLFNAHDPALFTELMADDVVLELAMAPAPVHGRAQAIDFYTNNVWKAFPDCAGRLADEPFFDLHTPRIALEWPGTGTLTGRLDPPGLDPTGKSFDLRCGRCSNSVIASPAG